MIVGARPLIAIACAVLLAGCAGRAPAAAPTPADLRACAVPMTARTPEAQAVACAEEFIARNGYTDTEPGDRTRFVSESVERGSAEETLGTRRGSLESRATVVCADSAGDAYTVVFRRQRSSQTSARAVTMTARFDEIRVQHRDLILANVPERRFGCRPVE